MDEMYCLLITKAKLAEELEVNLRTILRRTVAHEFLALNERNGRAWVAIECDASPERQWYLENLVRDLTQRIRSLERQLSESQEDSVEELMRRHGAENRAKELETQNITLTESASHAARELDLKGAELEEEKQRAKARRDEDAALIDQMAAAHRQELDREKEKHQEQLNRIRNSNSWYQKCAHDTETKARRQIVTRTWTSMLVGAAVCGCVTTSLALLLG